MVAAHTVSAGGPVPAVLDGPAVRRWADAGLAALETARTEIDHLNVYPVPDADTGTNLVRTMRAGVEALAAMPSGPDADSLAAVSETLATAVLRGACGNSGTIVSQLLRGLADAARGTTALDGPALAAALAGSAALARAALARPVEGTILSVADAAARAAEEVADRGGELRDVVSAARGAAQEALQSTPDQLAALLGRVDAGGRGLVVLLEALELAVSGADRPPVRPADSAAMVRDFTVQPILGGAPNGPAYEVMYLLETAGESQEGARVAGLRTALDELGDSVVVVGGNGLWQVHAHVDDIGGALEAGLVVGRPHRVRVVTLTADWAADPGGDATGDASVDASVDASAREELALLALVDGPGLTDLLTRAGARVVPADQALAGLATAAADAGARLVAVLPGDVATLAAATDAAGRDERLRVVRSRSAVQVIAAVAVHERSRSAERDLLEMSTAAASCRHGLVEVAEGDGMTSAGRCQPGDVLGHVDGDVAVIGHDLLEVAVAVVQRLLGGGGELVTLVAGQAAEPGFAEQVAKAVRAQRPDVDVTAYDGGQPSSYLLVGVE